MLSSLRTLSALCVLVLGLTLPAFAIDSGSDGSDGALTFAASAGTIDLDPVALGIDPDGDLVFHFTTIDIPAGTTVRMRSDRFGEGRPIIWLAQGDVTIAGTIQLRGANGHGLNAAIRLPALSGAGGYQGGLGQTTMGDPATAGNGPGGGIPLPGEIGIGGGHRINGWLNQSSSIPGGNAYGNQFLLPLTGGSGGSGGSIVGGTSAAGGGGGGGAIMIASSTNITFSAGSMIDCRGGSGGTASQVLDYLGGGGGGGGVRLVADSVTGDTTIDVSGGFGTGNFTGNGGGAGWIRIEALTRSLFGTASLVPSATYGHPGPIFLPASAPKVRVTQIGSNPVPATTSGSYVTPDLTIDESGAVTLTLEANNVPIGTTVDLVLRSETGATVNVTSTPLTGTLATSTATAGPVTIPHGFNRFTIHATFTP